MEKVIISKTFTPLVDSQGNTSTEISVGVRTEHIQQGMIKRMGYRGFCILTVLVSYMNKEYISFPSMTRIGELTGLSRQTVSKGITDLIELGIIEKTQIDRRAEYRINYTSNFTNDPILLETLEKETEEVPEVVFTSAKDVAFYFAKKYEKQYGHKYMINYGRDLSLIKNKIMTTYDNNEIIAVIDTAIEKYRDEWANDKYPYPTVPMLATWLGNQAMGMVKEKKTKESKLYDTAKDAKELDESEMALDIF